MLVGAEVELTVDRDGQPLPALRAGSLGGPHFSGADWSVPSD